MCCCCDDVNGLSVHLWSEADLGVFNMSGRTAVHKKVQQTAGQQHDIFRSARPLHDAFKSSLSAARHSLAGKGGLFDRIAKLTIALTGAMIVGLSIFTADRVSSRLFDRAN